MVDTEIFSRRLDALESYLDRLRRLGEAEEPAYLANPGIHDLAARCLHLAVEAAIDVANHWIADQGLRTWAGRPRERGRPERSGPHVHDVRAGTMPALPVIRLATTCLPRRCGANPGRFFAESCAGRLPRSLPSLAYPTRATSQNASLQHAPSSMSVRMSASSSALTV